MSEFAAPINEPNFVVETLAWCNARRAERGKKPLARLPKGGRRDPKRCPCAKATGLLIYSTTWSERQRRRFGRESNFKRKPLPWCVKRFIKVLGWGELPQYDSEAA